MTKKNYTAKRTEEEVGLKRIKIEDLERGRGIDGVMFDEKEIAMLEGARRVFQWLNGERESIWYEE